MKRIRSRNPKFKWQVISFDFDETLAYMYPPIHETIGIILQRHGVPGKAKDIAEVLKDRSKQTRHPLLEERGWGQLTDEEQKEVLSHINRQILKQIGLASNLDFLVNAINNEWFATRKLYPDVPQALTQLKEMGMTITIVAGPTSAMIKEVLEKHNLLRYIECFATTDIVSLGLMHACMHATVGGVRAESLKRGRTKPLLRELRISGILRSYAHALVASISRCILHMCIQITSFFEEHPNVSYFLISLVLAVSLHIIYSVVASIFPPRTMGEYIVFAEYSGNLYSITHRYMLPVVYSSVVFLIPSLSYLNRKMARTFEEIKDSIKEPEQVLNKSLKLASSHYRYLFASVVGFLLLFGPFTIIWIFFVPFGLVYIAFPTAVIIWLIYFLVAFFSALGIWFIFVSVYFINQIASQQFEIDIEDPSSWIDDDEIGGFKPVSDFSLQVFGWLIFGILLFSPAAILYYATWYVAYIFALLPIDFLFCR